MAGSRSFATIRSYVSTASLWGSTSAVGSDALPWNVKLRTAAPAGTGTISSASWRDPRGFSRPISSVVVAACSRMTTSADTSVTRTAPSPACDCTRLCGIRTLLANGRADAA
jgi:hypothetical protein